MKVFISGRITNGSNAIVKGARQQFNQAELFLLRQGHTVINPLNLPKQKNWLQYMKQGIKELMNCDAIYLLKTYPDSKGALIEKQIAILLDYQILYE